MERAFLRSASVVPEGDAAADEEVAPPGGDDPGGALMVTETWMLILSEGSTPAEGSELGLGCDDEEEEGDPVKQPADSLKSEKAFWQAVSHMTWHAKRNLIEQGQPCQHKSKIAHDDITQTVKHTKNCTNIVHNKMNKIN